MPPPEPRLDAVELLARHKGQLARLIHRLVDPADRDDVRQEVALAALERPPRSATTLPAWIATTVRNLAAKRLRSKGRLQRREQLAATPEALPSSAELVGRLDLESQLLCAVRELPPAERDVVLLRYFEGRSSAAIAAALELSESTVRARLARAIETLRARLDRDAPGGRQGWIALLAPGSGVAPFALGSKALLAVAASFLAVGTLALLPPPAPVDEPLVAQAPRPEVATVAEREALGAAAASPLPVAATREPAAAAPPGFTIDPNSLTRSVPPSGTLALRAVDGATGALLPKATLRALAEARFATSDFAPAEGELRLTAGDWDLALHAPGYEPLLLAQQSIAADGRLDLGTLALSRGTATLEGRLVRHGNAANRRAFVELRGDGRSACPRCGDATVEPVQDETLALGAQPLPKSPCCGWFWDRSLVEVGADGRFRFDRLAAGWYFVRPLDESARLQPTVAIELASGAHQSLELHLAPPQSLDLLLLDGDGAPFVGVWAPDSESLPPPIHFDLLFEHIAFTLDGGTDGDAVRRRHGPPPLEGQCERLPPEWEGDGIRYGDSVAIATGMPQFDLHALLAGVADRARSDADALLPRPETPALACCEFAITRPAPNHFRLLQLPAARLSLQVRCQGFTSDRFEVDLALPDRAPVEVVLRPLPVEQSDPAPPDDR
ncbi:MAG: sigma-70 family RNA polymerase sigma factor [Planctomycetes bacterium]|nr:sigma-70 family RNA polymerase sigma factor [Planctomycetota bacterium]